MTDGSFSILFFAFWKKTTDTSCHRLVWRKDLFCVFSLFFTHLPLFVQAGGLVDLTEGIVVQSRTEIFFFSPRFPIFTKRTQTLCWRSCTHQIFYVLARHFTHISCCFYFIFLSGWQNKHALWCFGVARKQVAPTFFSPKLGELFLCSTS